MWFDRRTEERNRWYIRFLGIRLVTKAPRLVRVMKCKDCNADMEEFFEENMAVPVRGEFVTREDKIVSLYVCPKCGKVQGEVFKENGRIVKYC